MRKPQQSCEGQVLVSPQLPLHLLLAQPLEPTLYLPLLICSEWAFFFFVLAECSLAQGHNDL